jgi:RNA polymerase sigma-70 factor (ECF subfamily)
LSDESDEALAGRAGQGCRASFASLLERHYDRIYRLAWRWSGSAHMAEDIAQDVCVKLAKAIQSYRADAAFKTWLHRITYTTTIDALRVTQRTDSVEPSEIISLVDRSAAFAAPDETAHDGHIWQAVRSLPGQQRDAILLVYGEDMSHLEASHVMKCSEKTVSWHIHEAKKKLKILLEAVG